MPGKEAFCPLEKSPLCIPETRQTLCDGNDLIVCLDVWVTARFPCASCDLTPDTVFAGPCARGVDSPCMTDADCLPGYICYPFPSDESKTCGHTCDQAVCDVCSNSAGLPDGGELRACFSGYYY